MRMRNVVTSVLLCGLFFAFSDAHADNGIRSTYKTSQSGASHYRDNSFNDHVDLRYTGGVGSNYRIFGMLFRYEDRTGGGREWSPAANSWFGYRDRFRISYSSLDSGNYYPEYGFRMVWWKINRRDTDDQYQVGHTSFKIRR